MKINLAVDGNYLLYKQVFILKKIRRIEQDLEEMLFDDLSKLSKSFPFDNIYLVSDPKTKSWRKLRYPEYKAKRIRDDSIDWPMVYDIYAKFKEKVKQIPNIKFLEQDGLEGDDLIAHIVREGNKKGYSNLIVASDGDLNQLVEYDINKGYINFQWNFKYSSEVLYSPQNYQLFINNISENSSNDLFELDNSHEFIAHIDKMQNNAKVSEVIPEEVLFIKLVWGDKGDNIPTCIKTKAGKIDPDGRGIGKDGAKSVYDIFKDLHPSEIDFKDEKFLNDLAEVVIYYKKLVLNDENKKEIIKNIKFNMEMMALDTDYMPTDVYENMKNYYNHVESIDRTVVQGNLEKILEEKGHFKDKEDIPENFRIDKSTEEFDADAYWDL